MELCERTAAFTVVMGSQCSSGFMAILGEITVVCMCFGFRPLAAYEGSSCNVHVLSTVSLESRL